MTEISAPERDHLLRIASPLAVGMSLGRQILGYEMQTPAHLRFLEGVAMDAILDPKERFIAVSVPPRMGKTDLFGKFVPTWFLGTFPDKQVIYASYAEERSKEIGRWVRDAFRARGPDLFGYGVNPEASSAVAWRVGGGHQGKMLSVGRGGPILGEPGHLIIADDLFKGPKEAASIATRKEVSEWFDDTLRQRLEPGGTIILFFQRWSIDDLIGTLKERCKQAGYTGDEWEFYNLPALAEPMPEENVEEEDLDDWVDPIGRKYGEALWPERRNREQMLRIKGNGEQSFRTVQQGDPTAGKDGWFPRDRWVNSSGIQAPEMVKQVRIWDLAATKDGGDWTVGMKLGRDRHGDLWVLDVERNREHPDETQKRVRRTAQADGNHVKIMIEQERAGSGTTVIAMYKRYLAGFHVEPARADGTKEERAKPANEFQSLRRCHVPLDAPWAETFMKELESFLRQKRDDQVDAFAYGFRELIANGSPMEMWFPQVTMPMSPGQIADLVGSMGGVWN